MLIARPSPACAKALGPYLQFGLVRLLARRSEHLSIFPPCSSPNVDWPVIQSFFDPWCVANFTDGRGHGRISARQGERKGRAVKATLRETDTHTGDSTFESRVLELGLHAVFGNHGEKLGQTGYSTHDVRQARAHTPKVKQATTNKLRRALSAGS